MALVRMGRAARIGAGTAALLAISCVTPPREPIPRAAPATGVETSIILIGDAGAPDASREPVLRALVEELASASSPSIVVFLGDNIYPKGMPQPGEGGRAEAERRLDAQVDAVLESGATGIFIPGNHDWNFAGSGGRARVIEAERFGVDRGSGRVSFVPGNGCPGPVGIDVGAVARLILLDTQWWLDAAFDSPVSLVDCPTRSASEVLDSLGVLLEADGRTTIVAGHHPLITYGAHGGFFNLRQHLFPLTDLKSWLWIPLPVIGSAYPFARTHGITNQDVSGPRYRRMLEVLDSVFAVSPPLVYAAGHEHAIQILDGGGARVDVVSGAGIYGHVGPVTRGPATIYHAGGGSGYVRLDVQRDGRVRLAVVIVDAEGGRSEPYSAFLR
jgi:hypothetical protein